MATYVLVHGSYQGSWIWKLVAPPLIAAGHAVYRPTLDGSAERKGSLRRDITLKSVGQEIANLFFYEDLRDVVFVGTSSGGMVVVDDPVDLKEFWSRTWQVDVLRCTRGALPPQAHQQRTAEKLGGTYTELDAGHYPMLSHPEEIATYLLAHA